MNPLNKCILPDLGKLSPFLQKHAKKPPFHPSRKCRRYGSYILRILLSVIIAAFLSGCANLASYVPVSIGNHKPEIILSTSHRTFTENNQPSEIKIGSDTLYAITKWRNLKGKLINYLCKMYDGDGELAFSMGGRILPDQPVYYYQSNYGPHPAIDKQGMWRIEIYVDNVLVATRELMAIE